jgi:hypothetical protein
MRELTDWRWEVVSFIRWFCYGRTQEYFVRVEAYFDMASRLIETSFSILILRATFIIVVN